jgi:hypothetical protein
MKGEMFLLAAVIIITAIVIAASSFRPTSISVEKTSLMTQLEKENLENLANEMQNTIEFSYNIPDNMTLNAFAFGNFTRRKMSEKALSTKIFFAGIVTNVSTNEMNVTTINLMGEKINVTLQLNTSTPQSASVTDLADYGKWSTKFTSVANNTDYSLNITYSLNSKNVTILVGTKDLYTAYFDLRLESDKSLLRKVFEKSYSL